MLWKPAYAPDLNLLVEHSISQLILISLWNNLKIKHLTSENLKNLNVSRS